MSDLKKYIFYYFSVPNHLWMCGIFQGWKKDVAQLQWDQRATERWQQNHTRLRGRTSTATLTEQNNYTSFIQKSPQLIVSKGFKTWLHCSSCTKTFYYHLFCIHAVQSFAVFNQPLLIKVLLAAVRAREGEAIWEAPGWGRKGDYLQIHIIQSNNL